MCIKYNEDKKYIPIIMGSSREQRSAFQKRKEPYDAPDSFVYDVFGHPREKGNYYI